MVAFEDETWASLYPKVEAEWMPRGYQRRIITPGYNRRRNAFITLLWPKKYGLIFNTYGKRRSREFKQATPIEYHPV